MVKLVVRQNVQLPMYGLKNNAEIELAMYVQHAPHSSADVALYSVVIQQTIEGSFKSVVQMKTPTYSTICG